MIAMKKPSSVTAGALSFAMLAFGCCDVGSMGRRCRRRSGPVGSMVERTRCRTDLSEVKLHRCSEV